MSVHKGSQIRIDVPFSMREAAMTICFIASACRSALLVLVTVSLTISSVHAEDGAKRCGWKGLRLRERVRSQRQSDQKGRVGWQAQCAVGHDTCSRRGNFGDGRINAYDLATGHFVGRLKAHGGRPIKIDGLWGITFGNGFGNAPVNTLFFAAGPGDELHGLFGRIDVAPGDEHDNGPDADDNTN